ncbi:MAG: hypothetical protein HOF53_11580 [Gammaproteobacteria bacterium]|nr:hypothetical protein [Gammaproteobacteria bacterium]
MSLEQLTTLEAINQFLEGTQSVAFNVATDKRERYRWVQKTLVKHRYLLLGKVDRGIVTRYLMKVTGYSLAQTKRLIRQYVKTGTISVKPARRNGFKRAYTEVDIRLLASMDERHGQPSGAVLKKLCERAYQCFGQDKYQRLSGISVSHLYNLRGSKTYQRQRCVLTKTRHKTAPIGQRRKPCPNDQPGYIRIDSIHQGDQDISNGLNLMAFRRSRRSMWGLTGQDCPIFSANLNLSALGNVFPFKTTIYRTVVKQRTIFTLVPSKTYVYIRRIGFVNSRVSKEHHLAIFGAIQADIRSFG